MASNKKRIEALEQLVKKTGAKILDACEEYNSTYAEAVLGRKIRAALNFKTADTLYFSMIQVNSIVRENHERDCLKLRMVVNGYLQEVFNFY